MKFAPPVGQALVGLLFVSSCTTTVEGPEQDPPPGGELLIGELPPPTGDWEVAKRCKLPFVGNEPDWDALGFERLEDPHITVSIDGLTLHLVDRAGDYDKVFPIGVGQISLDETDLHYRESHSMWPVLRSGEGDFTLHTMNTAKGNWQFNPCRVWGTDDDGKQIPYFAGLPFMRLSHPTYNVSAYGIHGPIDGFTAENGGNLVRGYVSHGCVRSEAADLTEVYARVRHHEEVPVHIQRAPERTADGRRVEVERTWIGLECQSDDDCRYEAGYCADSPYGRGFCSKRCTSTCPDLHGYPETFCVTDPEQTDLGMCVVKEWFGRSSNARNFECRPYDHQTVVTRRRHSDPSVLAKVCMPGSPGWVGDLCLDDRDCDAGNRCAMFDDSGPGVCTRECVAGISGQFCEDKAGSYATFCIDEARLGGVACARQCDPASGGAECPLGFECQERSRAGDPVTLRHVCVPR